MKLTKDEKNQLSTSIDKMNEALDVFIELYNESEEDLNIIELEEQTVQAIKFAMETYGKEAVTKKINTIIREIFSFVAETKGSST